MSLLNESCTSKSRRCNFYLLHARTNPRVRKSSLIVTSRSFFVFFIIFFLSQPNINYSLYIWLKENNKCYGFKFWNLSLILKHIYVVCMRWFIRILSTFFIFIRTLISTILYRKLAIIFYLGRKIRILQLEAKNNDIFGVSALFSLLPVTADCDFDLSKRKVSNILAGKN